MKKLDVEMYIYGGNVVVGRILHQDESLRKKEGDANKLFANLNGFYIRSSQYPAATTDALYVQGSARRSDDKPVCAQFSSNEAAENFVAHIKAMLDEINAGTEGSSSKSPFVKVI